MQTVNLLPWRKKQLKNRLIAMITINVMVLLIASCFFILYKYSLHLDQLKKHNASLQNKNQILKLHIKKTQTKLKALDTINKTRNKNEAILNTFINISHFIPENVILLKLHLTQNILIVEGQATTQAAMTTFSEALFRLKYFNRHNSLTIGHSKNTVNFKVELTHEIETNTDY